MSCLLNIETATSVCSVALSVDNRLIFEKVSPDGPSHAAMLGVFAEEALTFAKQKSLKLDAVAVSSGPGSYTGLRIGVSMAKGLCFGYGIPLISVPTLEIIASKTIRQINASGDALYCAMLDARRMEVYAAIYTDQLKQVRETTADIVTNDTYSSYLQENKIYFFGNGSAKCKEVILSPNAVFIDDIYPLAADMIPLSTELFNTHTFVDTAYFEPFYLKEFIATTPKNKVLGTN